MHFRHIYSQPAPAISLELFPAADQELQRHLELALPRLLRLQPALFTVNFGIVRAEHEATIRTAAWLQHVSGLTAACHLNCTGASPGEFDEILCRLHAEKIRNIIVLRGDMPAELPPNAYRYAIQLVEHIRRFTAERRLEPFGIAVAGHPETHPDAGDSERDMINLKRKVDAGADIIITQLFYDNEVYFRFLERVRKAGIELPVIPGLLPITLIRQLPVLTGRCGVSIPRGLKEKVETLKHAPAALAREGERHVIEQARGLLQAGVAGIHFYHFRHAVDVELLERVMSGIRAGEC